VGVESSTYELQEARVLITLFENLFELRSKRQVADNIAITNVQETLHTMRYGPVYIPVMNDSLVQESAGC